MYRIEEIAELELHRSERLVALELGILATRKGLARVSQIEIAARTGLSRQTVNAALRSLIDAMLVVREGQGRYRLTPETFAPATRLTRAEWDASEQEWARLREIVSDDQYIAADARGWPSIVNK